MSKSNYGTDALAFLIVECNVSLPYDVAVNLTSQDPLYTSIVQAWKNRDERADYRNALLCTVMNNSMGGRARLSDFLPKKKLTVVEREAQIKANVLNYNSKVDSDKSNLQ